MRFKLIQNYYQSPEYLEKLRGRVQNLQLITADMVNRKQMLYDLYSNDFEKYCEDFLFLIIPEYADAIKPFFLFDYQKQIIAKLREAEAGGQDVEILIDKPRGMGLSWLMVAYFNWRWMFQPNWSAFVLSRTEVEVDDGTTTPNNSLFSKFRWLLLHQPKWTLPEGFKLKEKLGNANDSTLRIINPEIKSGIFGSSTNSNAGRSRRYSITFVDECFAIDRFTEVHRSLTSVSRVQVYVSTTKASREAKNFKDSIKPENYISLNWYDHPWKDKEWYKLQLEKAEFDPEIMKEVDKGYAIAEKLQYYPEIKFSKVAKIKYNPELPVYCGLDFGKGDLTVIVWAQFDGNQINIIECYYNSNKGKASWYAPFLNPEFEPEQGVVYTDKALEFMKQVRKFGMPKGFFGELAHSIKSMADGTSIANTMARCGIRIMWNNYAVEHEPRRTATALLLPKMVFNEDSENVMKLYDAVTNSRYSTSTSTKTGAMKPVHDDEIADFRSALENLCVNTGRIFKYQRKESQEGSMRDDSFAAKMIAFLKV